jgi:hypothetical protein
LIFAATDAFGHISTLTTSTRSVWGDRHIRARARNGLCKSEKAMVGRLHEKVALVVGAGSVGPGWGNGKAAAVLFAREGAKVLCADVNEDAANETV